MVCLFVCLSVCFIYLFVCPSVVSAFFSGTVHSFFLIFLMHEVTLKLLSVCRFGIFLRNGSFVFFWFFWCLKLRWKFSFAHIWAKRVQNYGILYSVLQFHFPESEMEISVIPGFPLQIPSLAKFLFLGWPKMISANQDFWKSNISRMSWHEMSFLYVDKHP